MTVLTIAGTFVDRDGLLSQTEYGWNGRAATVHRTFSADPAKKYRSTLASHIPVNIGHRGADIGEAIHLEENGSGALTAVAVIEGPACLDLLRPSRGPFYWSPEIDIRGGGDDIELTGLAVTDNPAYIGLTPLEVHIDDVRDLGWRSRQSFLNPPRLLERAAVSHRRRGLFDPIVIEGHTQAPEPVPEWVRRMDARAASRPSGRKRMIDGEMLPIEHSAPYYGGILSVR